MTTRGVPLIYYGDEIAMPGGNDPDNRRDFPGGFAGDKQDAFTEAGRSADERAVFTHLRRVVRLRQELEPLRRGKLVTLGFSDTDYSFARVSATGTVVVVFNNAGKAASIEVDLSPLKISDGRTLTDRLGASAQARVEGGKVRVNLSGRSASIFTMK